jgi:hypothetical protein
LFDQLNLEAGLQDTYLIDKIVERAVQFQKKKMALAPALWRGPESFRMDLLATHLNGCELDLPRLLAVPDDLFAHDIFGIFLHLDRDTGVLRDGYLPVCRKEMLDA